MGGECRSFGVGSSSVPADPDEDPFQLATTVRKLNDGAPEVEPLTKTHAPEMFAVLPPTRAVHGRGSTGLARGVGQMLCAVGDAAVRRRARALVELGGARQSATSRAIGFVQATVREDGSALVAYVIAPVAQEQGFARGDHGDDRRKLRGDTARRGCAPAPIPAMPPPSRCFRPRFPGDAQEQQRRSNLRAARVKTLRMLARIVVAIFAAWYAVLGLFSLAFPGCLRELRRSRTR